MSLARPSDRADARSRSRLDYHGAHEVAVAHRTAEITYRVVRVLSLPEFENASGCWMTDLDPTATERRDHDGRSRFHFYAVQVS